MNTCNANHCPARISTSKLMCPAHWALVPQPIQQAIWRAYRAAGTRGQRLASVAYLEACAAAVEHVAALEGRLTRNAYRNLANHVRAGLIRPGGAS